MAKTDVRQIALARMAELGWNRHTLAKVLHGRVHRSSLYEWLNGRAGLSSPAINHVLDALSLSIVRSYGESPETRG